MSIEALNWALNLDDKSLKSSRKFVLVVLANYSDEEWESFPSAARICKLTHLTNDTVWDSLKELEEKGYVTRIARRQADGSLKSNRYKLSDVVPTIAENSAMADHSREFGLPIAENSANPLAENSATILKVDPKEEPKETTGRTPSSMGRTTSGKALTGVEKNNGDDPDEAARENFHKQINGVDDVPLEWVSDLEIVLGIQFKVPNAGQREILELIEAFPDVPQEDFGSHLNRAVLNYEKNPQDKKATVKLRKKWLYEQWMKNAWTRSQKREKLPPINYEKKTYNNEREIDTYALYHPKPTVSAAYAAEHGLNPDGTPISAEDAAKYGRNPDGTLLENGNSSESEVRDTITGSAS